MPVHAVVLPEYYKCCAHSCNCESQNSFLHSSRSLSPKGRLWVDQISAWLLRWSVIWHAQACRAEGNKYSNHPLSSLYILVLNPWLNQKQSVTLLVLLLVLEEKRLLIFSTTWRMFKHGPMDRHKAEVTRSPSFTFLHTLVGQRCRVAVTRAIRRWQRWNCIFFPQATSNNTLVAWELRYRCLWIDLQS
jgi:hypothetical protein